MRTLAIFFLIVSSFLAGCTIHENTTSQSDNLVNENYENDSCEYDIYISHTTECSRKDQNELYETMRVLLTDRAVTQFSIASPDIDLTSENVFGAKDSVEYYPLKDSEVSFEKIRNQLLEVYEADYVDNVLLPYYFETAELYVEQELMNVYITHSSHQQI